MLAFRNIHITCIVLHGDTVEAPGQRVNRGGLGEWFDVVGGGLREVGLRAENGSCASRKVMFINCYQCAGA